ncbi:MAG: ferritin-like domain-containing protein [Alphaproteobacteria bacterium]|nr:ferritin-like domain-containing protein [Alphaproteobacteria bacterium]
MTVLNRAHWNIDDLPWDRFDPQRLLPSLLNIVKAAAMVEYGAEAYAQYLCNVFPDDPIFQRATKYWAAEEMQHGATLGRYAELADPQFHFDQAFARFKSGYSIKTVQTQSVRGSRSGELIARCIVEVGTSSYYTALGEAVDEPLLKAVCHNIATDEFRHYGMFFNHLKGYLEHEKPGRLRRLKIGISRIREAEDDELAYAYFAANAPSDAVYNREASAMAYMARAFPLYKLPHVRRMVAMVSKACGLPSHAGWITPASRMALWFMQRKSRRAMKVAATTFP